MEMSSRIDLVYTIRWLLENCLECTGLHMCEQEARQGESRSRSLRAQSSLCPWASSNHLCQPNDTNADLRVPTVPPALVLAWLGQH